VPLPDLVLPPAARADHVMTERLVLRQWTAADREPFAAMNADPAVMEHFPAQLTRAESNALVARIEAAIATNGWGLWAIEVATGADAGRFAGFTGLSVPGFDAPFTPCVEVGWRLARWSWGRGYATEAARAALDIGFERVGLDEILSFTARPNIRSQAVMQRLGMTTTPDDDFDHPLVEASTGLRRHVLYRKRR
jgi:ribosomal-protein-alanine N-acetyltransferase